MLTRFILVYFGLAVAACDGDPSSGSYAEATFDRILAEGELCEEWQEMGANCTQWLTLDSDGRATIVVTDIINGGTWTEDDAMVFTAWQPNGDVVPEIEYSKAENAIDLVDENGNTWWRRQE